MSQENVQIVRASLDAAQRGDLTTALSCYSEDVRWFNRPPEVGPYQGREGVMKAIASFVEQFDDYWFDAEEIVEAGDNVVLLWRQGGKGRSSQAPIEEDGATVFTLAAGHICRAEVHSDRAAALEAAGLAE